MKHGKTLNLLNQASDSRFVTGKRNIINDNSFSCFKSNSEMFFTFPEKKQFLIFSNILG